MTSKDGKTSSENDVTPARHRSAARLGAVQALYEIEVTGAKTDPVLREFIQERWESGGDIEDQLISPDNELLCDLVRSVAEQRAELDNMIASSLSGSWTLERVEILLLGILRAGVYELRARKDIPARAVINEYIELTHAFFEGQEASLVNAVLDRLARVLRPSEFDAKVPGNSGSA